MKDLMRLRGLLIALSALILVACAAPVALNKQTSTGMPERLFVNTSTDNVKHALIDWCLSKKLSIEEKGTTTVVCSNTMDGGDGILAQLVLGNSYSTTPTRNAVFTVTKRGNDAFLVMSSYYIETIMAMGQSRKQVVDDNATKNQAQSWIDALVVEPNPPVAPLVPPKKGVK